MICGLEWLLPLFIIILPIPHGSLTRLERRPVVTIALVWLNFLIFLITILSGHYEAIIEDLGYVPALGRPWTLLTYQFLHGGVFHLIGNMLFLWVFGANVEDRLGKWIYLALYLLSGAVAVVFFSALGSGDRTTPCIGASGSIYGIMGAFFVLMPLAEIRVTYVLGLALVFWRVRTIPTAGLFIAPFYVIWNYIESALFPDPSVAYLGHIGGFLFGVVCMLVYRIFFIKPERPLTRREGLKQESVEPVGPEGHAIRQIKEALYTHQSALATQLYLKYRQQGFEMHLRAIDALSLAEAMVENSHFKEAVRVLYETGHDRGAVVDLRARALQRQAEIYQHHLNDVPEAIKILNQALEQFPDAAPADAIYEELCRLELKGFPPICEK